MEAAGYPAGVAVPHTAADPAAADDVSAETNPTTSCRNPPRSSLAPALLSVVDGCYGCCGCCSVVEEAARRSFLGEAVARQKELAVVAVVGLFYVFTKQEHVHYST